MDALKRELNDLYEKIKKQTEYNAVRFRSMLDSRFVGTEAAKILILGKETTAGFEELKRLGRLDLTVEALIVESVKWGDELERLVVETAKARLKQAGYNPQEPS